MKVRETMISFQILLKAVLISQQKIKLDRLISITITEILMIIVPTRMINLREWDYLIQRFRSK